MLIRFVKRKLTRKRALPVLRGGNMNVEADVLERANEAFAEALAEALDIREHETGDHSKRVACHTMVLARRFITDPHYLRQIYWGALLHDAGKIGVSDAILLKHDALNEDEWMEMRTHPEKGYRIVSQIPAQSAVVVRGGL